MRKIIKLILLISLQLLTLLGEGDKQWEFEKELNAEELSYVFYIRREGISVATRDLEHICKVNEDGSYKGFHYSLFIELCRQLDWEYKLDFVEFKEFFIVDGKSVDQVTTKVGKDADAFKLYDLFLAELTDLEWRERIMKIIPLVPSRILLVSRKDEKLVSLKELDGRKVVVRRRTSYEHCFRSLEQREGIKLNYKFVSKPKEYFEALIDKRADFSARDALRLIGLSRDYPSLKICREISELQYQGWAVSLKNSKLEGILTKFFKYALDSGIIDKFWRQSYGNSYLDYLSLLGMEE